jgi:hypothetical protein
MFTKLTDTTKGAVFTVLVLFLSVGVALSINMLDLGSNLLMWGTVGATLIHRSAWNRYSRKFARPQSYA